MRDVIEEPTIDPPLPQLPLRVLVLGASSVVWTSWMSGPRTDLALPRAIEAQLRTRGHDAEVRTSAILAQHTKRFFDTWERDVAQWSPDVVVCVAGHTEVMHLFLPRWLERYCNRVDSVPGGRLATWWRRRAVRAGWKALATLQSKIDGLLSRNLRQRRMRRVARQLAGYITVTRQVQTPGFVVLELLPPAPKQQRWFPGAAPRIELLNQLIREVVASFDTPDVASIPVEAAKQRLYGDDLTAATPDGYHFTPRLHRALADDIATWIENWANAYPHLGGRADGYRHTRGPTGPWPTTSPVESRSGRPSTHPSGRVRDS